MEIIGWGRKYQPHRYRNELRDYGELHVIVLTQGSLRVESAEISRDIGPRSVLVLPPRATFTLSTPRQAYQGHFVLAPPQQSGLPPRVHLFRADAPLLRTIIDIETELSQTSQHQVVRALYLVLYARAMRRARELQAPSSPALLDHVDKLILANCYTDASLERLLDGLPLGMRQLRRLYRRERGTTLKQAQLSVRLTEASRLLDHSGLSISSVAMELGFPSSQHFATQFRRFFGKTPTAYRDRPGRGKKRTS